MNKCSNLLAALFLFSTCSHAAAPREVLEWVQKAGDTEDEKERQRCLETLAALPGLDATLKREADALAAFAKSWNEGGLKFYNSFTKGKPPQALGDYAFGVAVDSPLFPLTALYRGRMLAWNLIENSTVRTHPKLAPWFKDEAVKSFQTAAAAFPKNRLPRMYLGEAIPWPKVFKAAPEAPEWAVLQREQLERMGEIIRWWIRHRQRADGQFGGGWGDDCEMWRWWASVLLGFDDPEITAAQLKFSKAAMNRPHLKGGFNTEIMDVEHAAEDTTDNLVPLLILEPNEKRWQDWSRKLVTFMRTTWTGNNQRGGLQFKSFYFSATEAAPQPQRALDVIANVGALHPAFMVWRQTGDASLGAPLEHWLSTWVDAAARGENGKPAGILPAAIRWPDGAAAGAEKQGWWEPVKPGGYMHSYYLWPSVITEMTDALVVAYLQSGNEKFLTPIRSMAAIRLKHLKQPATSEPAPGSEAWCAAQLGPRRNANSNTGGLVKTLARLKALTGTTEFDELLALEGGEFVLRNTAEGHQELLSALRESADALRVNFPGFTSEVRSTDRVMRFAQFLSQDYDFDNYKGVTVPKHELLYRMVTGDTNAPRFPQMAVRWHTPAKDIAVLVTRAGVHGLTADLHHFGESPRVMEAELMLLKPGVYRVSLESGSAVTKLPDLEVKRGVTPRLPLTLAPKASTRLRIEP